LFPKLKEFLKGCKFTDDEAVICTANARLEDQERLFFYSGIRFVWRIAGPVAGDLMMNVNCVTLRTPLVGLNHIILFRAEPKRLIKACLFKLTMLRMVQHYSI